MRFATFVVTTAVLVGACSASSEMSPASPEPFETVPGPTSTGAVASTTAAPTTAPEQPPATSAPSDEVTRPVRVGVAGDSVLLGVIPPLQRALEHSGHEFEARWFIGLLQVDGADNWEDLLELDVDVLVLLFAPWEAASLDLDLVVDGDDPEWAERYRREFVEPAIELLADTGIELVWLSPPTVAERAVEDRNTSLDVVWRDAIEHRPSMTWLAVDRELVDADGSQRFVDHSDGVARRLFKADGVHLCPEGGRRVAAAVLELLAQRGVTIDPGWVDTDWSYNPMAYGLDGCEV